MSQNNLISLFSSRMFLIIPLIAGYILDQLFGDPAWFPNPVIFFGKLIKINENQLNQGKGRFVKGSLQSIILCIACYAFFLVFTPEFACFYLQIPPIIYLLIATPIVFSGLAARGLINECRQVFNVFEILGLDAARLQLSRIVGRDTSGLDISQVHTATLETLSENLCDGVIAPLFYYAIAGLPGMMTYKMINTLDSMIGHRSKRFEKYGKFSARLDDIANFIPARLTSLLMVIVSVDFKVFSFIYKYGNRHKSLNSGYPEAAMAGILNLKFGGPSFYQGVLIDKPFIGDSLMLPDKEKFMRGCAINQLTSLSMLLLVIVFIWFTYA